MGVWGVMEQLWQAIHNRFIAPHRGLGVRNREQNQLKPRYSANEPKLFCE